MLTIKRFHNRLQDLRDSSLTLPRRRDSTHICGSCWRSTVNGTSLVLFALDNFSGTLVTFSSSRTVCTKRNTFGIVGLMRQSYYRVQVIDLSKVGFNLRQLLFRMPAYDWNWCIKGSIISLEQVNHFHIKSLIHFLLYGRPFNEVKILWAVGNHLQGHSKSFYL